VAREANVPRQGGNVTLSELPAPLVLLSATDIRNACTGASAQRQLTSRKTGCRERKIMSNRPAARTPGAKRAAPGEYVFNLRNVQEIMGGPAYSTAHGPCVEGDRMIVGLMRMKAGTGAEPHSHPNEQWIYVLEGTFRANIDGKEIDVTPGSVVYIPANTVHAGKATADGDVVFFTVKDASHGLHGMKAT
jgi:quercetin dioxygenase-like cupin family protein